LLSLVSDAQNRLYVLGKSLSTNYPAFGFDPSHNGGMDYVVSRLNPAGTQLLSSTYLGGNGMDGENFGSTQMQNLNALWFNYGDNNRGEITLDPAGRVLIVGNTTSTNFPTSGLSAHQQAMAGVQDGVLVKLSANLDSLIYGTYLGGDQQDAIYGIRAMGVDTVYITGSTFSNNFPISLSMGGYIPQYQGGGDGFLMAIRTTGGPPIFGTFIGNATYQQAYLLDRDAEGRVYVTGISTSALAITPSAIYNNPGGKHFIQVFSSDLDSLLLGTMIGANSAGPNFSPTAFMVDVCGKVYLTGWGGSVNTARNIHVSSMVGLPVTAQRLQANTDHHDMYVMVLESNLDSLLYGSFFGGGLSREHVDGGTCRFSRDGVIYHAVCAGCGGGNDDFPTTTGAWSATNNSLNCNAAVFKIDLQYVQPVAGFATQYPDTFVCMGIPVQFFSTGTLSGTFLWDFGVPGAQSTQPNPTYSFPAPGTYRVSQRISSCVGTDTIGRNIIVKPVPTLLMQQVPAICLGDSATLTASGARVYEWDSLYSGGGNRSSSIRVAPPASRWYRVVAYDSLGCPVTDSVWVRVNIPRRVFSGAIYRYCLGDTARISVPAAGYSSVQWISDPEITSATAFNQKFASMQARWVYLELTDTAGCRLRDSLRLSPFISLSVDAGPNRTICSPTQLTFVAQAPPQARFLWSTGDTSRQISFFAGQSQTIWVRAFDPPCSSLTDTIQITFEPLQAAFGFRPDTGYAPQTVSFTQLSSGAAVRRYLWTFGDGGTSTLPAPVYTYMRPGRYTIVLRIDGDDPSCFDTAQSDIWIDSVGIRLPTAFTPDGDGVNDVFTGFNYGFETLSISIFDRWGRLVHTESLPRVYWDGTQQGMPLPAGSYPYIIRAVQKNGVRRTLKGVVDLIR
jgi:gliding motility-associated-like protein